ncbi:hypothetical protein ACFL0D_03545 [Thermoproteota archaeon]
MESIKKIGGNLVILAIAVAVGFFLTNILAESFSSLGETFLPFILWGLFTVVIAVSLRKLLNMGSGGEKRDAWGSPEGARDRVVNSPQFVGRFDRGRGLLESTARMVEQDRVQFQTTWMSHPKEMTVVRFRGEMLDQNGAPFEYVPVEIKGESSKWVGSIADGDRLRVSGKIEKDGILHAGNAFNFSTNSWVGER